MEKIDLQSEELKEILSVAHLRYINRYDQGYHRKLKGNTFYYIDAEGKKVKDQAIIKRINALVLPPAWTDVWICAHAGGHLQATGIDKAGRKQYKYHERWSKIKSQVKFGNLLSFGKHLGKLRRQLKKDVRSRRLDKQKVTAIAIMIMEDTFIRAGNLSYEQKYGSYGLTTLKNKHVHIKGASCFFRFRGKKGVQQNLSLTSKELARLLSKVKDIPGQFLFQYYDEDKQIHHLESGDINQYLSTYMEGDFTCKDFRTWAGTLLALNYMKEPLMDAQQKQVVSNKGEVSKNTLEIVDKVAAALGNTRTVAKKYYIHPALISAYESNELEDLVPQLINRRPHEVYKKGEKELLSFIKIVSGKLRPKSLKVQ